ncbi:haloalkanoic acid [Colletotrichum truncatum]|uniref:Haloalkanoic acid n=1 Tax=Colletotrichum truncatum TaxID=5467 RepID=A0ACC3ZEV5_COLTU|nr:haloalkanoic acid [Colletotrichum truncatum]KAF6801539.1 haloalkanoic acid [Colletotrichum truncatum]
MTSLKDFRVLTFDVYGTLIDWEGGVLAALQPLLDENKRTDFTRKHLLDVYHKYEAKQQSKTPDLPYHQLVATIHPQIAEDLGLAAPTAEASKAFGDSVGRWPAFPDTVDALRRLSKFYKLVVLSNVDRESFSRSNAGPLEGVPFDLIITAQDVGSYKPDQRNFSYMLQKVKETFGVEKDQVLQTAQSQFHDHHPAKEAGIKSSWIVRPGATMGNRDVEIYDWKFDTLGEMADALEKELA